MDGAGEVAGGGVGEFCWVWGDGGSRVVCAGEGAGAKEFGE